MASCRVAHTEGDTAYLIISHLVVLQTHLNVLPLLISDLGKPEMGTASWGYMWRQLSHIPISVHIGLFMWQKMAAPALS